MARHHKQEASNHQEWQRGSNTRPTDAKQGLCFLMSTMLWSFHLANVKFIVRWKSLLRWQSFACLTFWTIKLHSWSPLEDIRSLPGSRMVTIDLSFRIIVASLSLGTEDGQIPKWGKKYMCLYVIAFTTWMMLRSTCRLCPRISTSPFGSWIILFLPFPQSIDN